MVLILWWLESLKIPIAQGDKEEEANTIYIPFTTFNQAFNYGDRVGFMAITAHDEFSITEVKERSLVF